MLEDKLRTTDWEATYEAVEDAVARESYLQWLKDCEKRPSSSKSGAQVCVCACVCVLWCVCVYSVCVYSVCMCVCVNTHVHVMRVTCTLPHFLNISMCVGFIHGLCLQYINGPTHHHLPSHILTDHTYSPGPPPSHHLLPWPHL